MAEDRVDKPAEYCFEQYEQGATVAELLQLFFWSTDLSFTAVSDASGVDVAYIHRLVGGHKTNPSRDVLIRIGWGLNLAPHKMDELLLTAGFAPLFCRG
jgi:hypothetical protein